MIAGFGTDVDVIESVETLIGSLTVADDTAPGAGTYRVIETVTGVETYGSDAQHLGVSVRISRTANTLGFRDRDERRVEDTVLVTFHYQIGQDQRQARRRALAHVRRIRDEVDRMREWEAQYLSTDVAVDGGWYRVELEYTFHRTETIIPALTA